MIEITHDQTATAEILSANFVSFTPSSNGGQYWQCSTSYGGDHTEDSLACCPVVVPTRPVRDSSC